MFMIHVFKNTTRRYTVDLFEDDGSTESKPTADDEVRVKIGRSTDTPDLEIDSIAALSGGSIVTFTPNTNDVVLLIGQADIRNLQPGAYDCQILVVDQDDHLGAGASMENAIKHVEAGIVFIHPSQGGEFGDEESSSSSV